MTLKKAFALFIFSVVIIPTLLTSCAIPSLSLGDSHKEDGDNAGKISWKVGLSLPTSTFSLFSQSTVGSWSLIENSLVDHLVEIGYKKDNIIIKNAQNRPRQIKDINEMLEEGIDELVVVPIELSRASLLEGDDDSTKYETVQGESKSIVEILQKAKDSGIFTVGFGPEQIHGFTFDYFCATPSAEDVANVQAGFFQGEFGLPDLDEKGELPEPKEDWKVKNIEILAGDEVRETTKRYFSQLLNRLLPYYKAGYIQSLSGNITKDSTDDDYVNVAVQEGGDRSAGVMHNIITKFYPDAGSTDKPILDAAFAQTDAQSRGVVRAAVEQGWKQDQPRWPLVVGSNCEKLSVTDVVDGKQKMSIGWDSKALTLALSRILANAAQNKPQLTKDDLSSATEDLLADLDPENGTLYLEYVKAENDNESYPIVVARPVTVKPDNLKKFLVDDGYISAQDSGI